MQKLDVSAMRSAAVRRGRVAVRQSVRARRSSMAIHRPIRLATRQSRNGLQDKQIEANSWNSSNS